MARASDRFTVVGTFGSVAEAEMARGQLVAAGIAVRLDNAQTLGVLPMHSLALGGVGVVVATSDAGQAREILGFESEARPDEETEPGSAIALQAPDAWMRRAAVAAGFGSLLMPVVPTLYSVYLLGRHGRATLSRRGKRDRAIAVVFNGLALAIAGLFASVRCQV